MKSLYRWSVWLALASFFYACSPAAAQWQVPNNSVPVGRGSGATGFDNAAPGATGLPLVSQGASKPAFGPFGTNAMPAFGGGDVSFASGGGAGTIASNAVSNGKLAQMPANTVKCNSTGSSASPTDCTGPTVLTTIGGAGLGLANTFSALQTFNAGINVSGNELIQGGSTSPVNLYTSPPANGSFLSGAGNVLSYCSVGGCVSPLGDHQRATALFISTTALDGVAQENTLGLETTVATGFSTVWAQSTPYATNANVRANGNVYRARSPGGTSAASGTGPSGKGTGIADGTVVWDYINDGALDAKVGFYNAVNLKPGGGSTWAQANNLIVDSGAQKQFWVNTELNVTNNAGDCVVGSTSCYNLLLAVGGGNGSITANLAIAGKNGGSFYDGHYGLLLSGDHLASDIDVAIEGSAAVGLDFGFFGTSHSVATIRDTSTSPVSYFVGGTHSTATLQDTSTSATGLLLSGAYSNAGIDLSSSFGSYALKVKETQKICLNVGTNGCWFHQSGTTWLDGNFAIQDTGDLFFARHVSSLGSTPSVTSCGTGAFFNAGSNDVFGVVTEGTGASGCNINFAAARSVAPKCVVSPMNNVAATLVTTSTSAVSWTNASGGNPQYAYICMGS